MNDLTWVGFVGVLLFLSQLLSIYNSSKTAQKNATEPLKLLEKRITEIEKHVTGIDYGMNELKRDVDHAHDKIRENEKNYMETSKAQNKALLAILLWIKDPEHGDMHQIDEAIKVISES